jgi:hypothetical protein
MKKIIGLLSLAALFSVTACSNNKPPETTKEVIIVPTTATPTPIIVVPPPKSTTIVLDKNGVKVGTKKVDVTINPGKKNQ